MNILAVFTSASISFLIAWMGWSKLEKRSEKTSLRAESFSLLNPTVALLVEFRAMAEESVFQSLSDDNSGNKQKRNTLLLKRQSFDVKFHTKYQLLRTKLLHLGDRGIVIPQEKLIELRIAFTNAPIRGIEDYSKALNASDQIENELYLAFERAHSRKLRWYTDFFASQRE